MKKLSRLHSFLWAGLLCYLLMYVPGWLRLEYDDGGLRGLVFWISYALGIKTEQLSEVDPNYSADQQPFADAAIKSAYQAMGVSVGPTLSAPLTHHTFYDDMGRLSFTNDSAVTRDRFYSRTGALTNETITFKDGAVVKRKYEYNRRGQRTLATDSISGVTIASGETTGKTQYFYNNTTARLDSLVSWAGTDTLARVRWLYDRGGRDTLRARAVEGCILGPLCARALGPPPARAQA